MDTGLSYSAPSRPVVAAGTRRSAAHRQPHAPCGPETSKPMTPLALPSNAPSPTSHSPSSPPSLPSLPPFAILPPPPSLSSHHSCSSPSSLPLPPPPSLELGGPPSLPSTSPSPAGSYLQDLSSSSVLTDSQAFDTSATATLASSSSSLPPPPSHMPTPPSSPVKRSNPPLPSLDDDTDTHYEDDDGDMPGPIPERIPRSLSPTASFVSQARLSPLPEGFVMVRVQECSPFGEATEVTGSWSPASFGSRASEESWTQVSRRVPA